MHYANIILYSILTVINYYYILLIVQESHYHINGFVLIIKRIICNPLYYILLIPIITLFYNNLYISIFVNISVLIYILLRLKRKNILRLKITPRIQRFMFLKILYLIVLIYLSIKMIISEAFIMYLSYPFVIISYYLLMPIEIIIENYYVIKARKKINHINPIVIGITGSAGKTTCKNILYNLLKSRYNCFMTPKSYNTAMGIARSINEEMSELTEVAIIEYGASHKYDIQKSLRVVKPSISLITNIGLQHLETFKSKENIVLEKTRIMKCSKVHFYNKLSSYIVDCEKSISFSKFKGADYYLGNVKMDSRGTVFELCDNKDTYQFETKLLGENNLLNIIACIAICRYMGLSYEYLQKEVRKLKPVSSRLEIIDKNGLLIINDSFNSNKNGFLEALKILMLFEGEKALITPGVVSGGKEMEAINEDIAQKIVSYGLKCYLVSSTASKYYENVFKKENYDYEIVASFKDAYSLVRKENIKNLLIENDITDIYERKIK